MIPFGLEALMTVSLPIARRLAKCLVPGYSALYWCDEGSGTVLTDYSGNGNDGTLGAGAAAPTWTPQGLAFVSDDSASFPAITFTGAFSVFWVGYHPVEGGTDILFAHATDTTNKIGYALSGQNLYVRVGGTTNPGAGTYVPSAWHIATITRNATGAVSAYVNSTRYPLFTDTDPAVFNLIGTDSVGNCVDATLGAAGVYPYELSPAQIAQNYAAIKAVMSARGVTLP